MAQQNWWQSLVAKINATYERRIRAASLVTEYGADHQGHDDHSHGPAHAPHGEAHDTEAADDGAVIIANVPRGTRIPRDSAHSDHDDHHTP